MWRKIIYIRKGISTIYLMPNFFISSQSNYFIIAKYLADKKK